jgi:hypothetical protein
VPPTVRGGAERLQPRRRAVAAAVLSAPVALLVLVAVLLTAGERAAALAHAVPEAEESVDPAGGTAEAASEASAEASAEVEEGAAEKDEPKAGKKREGRGRGSQFLDTMAEAPRPRGKKRNAAAAVETPGPKKSGKGTLVAMAVGSSCSFAIDGAPRGSGSSVRVELEPGNHTVSCQPAGGSRRSRSVTVKPGQAATAVFKF